MKSTDRTILLGVAILGLIAAFWFLILAPKRQEASDLKADVAALETEVAVAEQEAAAGLAAKKSFPSSYRELISLGKAVPVDADTSSLLNQLQTLSVGAKVDFRSIMLGGSSGGAAPVTTEPAAALESTAAVLPIGATVGAAGLPVMPYELQFEGGFFEIADFFGAIDSMVDSDGKKTQVDGRLLTIDGFNFTPGPAGPPGLTASVNVTSYLTPVDEGITAGATPAGPAPATPATTPPTDSAAETAASTAAVAR